MTELYSELGDLATIQQRNAGDAGGEEEKDEDETNEKSFYFRRTDSERMPLETDCLAVCQQLYKKWCNGESVTQFEGLYQQMLELI